MRIKYIYKKESSHCLLVLIRTIKLACDLLLFASFFYCHTERERGEEREAEEVKEKEDKEEKEEEEEEEERYVD